MSRWTEDGGLPSRRAILHLLLIQVGFRSRGSSTILFKLFPTLYAVVGRFGSSGGSIRAGSPYPGIEMGSSGASFGLGIPFAVSHTRYLCSVGG
jgi:hypothetical protein